MDLELVLFGYVPTALALIWVLCNVKERKEVSMKDRKFGCKDCETRMVYGCGRCADGWF